LFPDCSTVIRGAPRLVPSALRLVVSTPRHVVVGAPRLVVSTPRLVVSTSRLVAGAPRYSQENSKFSPVLRRVPNFITIILMVLLYPSSVISLTLKAGRNALLQSNTLLTFTHLSLHSTSSQTLLEAPRD
jgi:hypothetical protein